MICILVGLEVSMKKETKNYAISSFLMLWLSIFQAFRGNINGVVYNVRNCSNQACTSSNQLESCITLPNGNSVSSFNFKSMHTYICNIIILCTIYYLYVLCVMFYKTLYSVILVVEEKC